MGEYERLMAIASIKAVGASAKRNSIPKSSVKTQSASATVDVELLKKQLIESSLKDAKQLSRGFAKAASGGGSGSSNNNSVARIEKNNRELPVKSTSRHPPPPSQQQPPKKKSAVISSFRDLMKESKKIDQDAFRILPTTSSTDRLDDGLDHKSSSRSRSSSISSNHHHKRKVPSLSSGTGSYTETRAPQPPLAAAVMQRKKMVIDNSSMVQTRRMSAESSSNNGDRSSSSRPPLPSSKSLFIKKNVSSIQNKYSASPPTVSRLTALPKSTAAPMAKKPPIITSSTASSSTSKLFKKLGGAGSGSTSTASSKFKSSSSSSTTKGGRFAPDNLTALNVNKRDLRSVDEIQQDIRAGRGLVHAKASVQEDRERAEERRQAAMERVKMKREGYDADDYSSDPRQYSHSKSHAPSPPPPASSSLAHKKPPVSSSQGNAATLKHNAAATGINDIFFETDPKLAQQIGTKPRTPLPSNNNHNDNTRRHVNGSSSSKPNQASSSSSNKKSKQKVEKRPPPSKQSASAAAGRKRRESTESSSEESLQPPPKSKKKKLNVDEALLDEDYAKKNISSIIGAMFGYDRRRYANMDEDDSDDMEAGFEDMRKEEARSARLAKKEDALAEAEEKKRLERIAMKKKQK